MVRKSIGGTEGFTESPAPLQVLPPQPTRQHGTVTALPTAHREALTATLRATGPGEAEGALSGHPASPMVRSTRSGDRLHVRFLLGERIIGAGVLEFSCPRAPRRGEK